MLSTLILPIFRIISFSIAFIFSVVLIVSIINSQKEKKKLEEKLNEIDHLNEEIHPHYVVLMFESAKEKVDFILNLGGDTAFNTFRVREKPENLRLRSTKNRREEG